MKRTGGLKRLSASVAALVLAGWSFVPPAQAVQTVTTNVAMPVGLNGTITGFDCENSPGPWITFEGSLTLGGVNVQLIFRNQRTDGAPHERVEEVHVAAGVAVGETIVIPKQPSHPFLGGEGTGVGGNPWISIQIVDANGNPLSGEIPLGRCVQGPLSTSVNFLTPVFAQAVLDVADCTNNPGPYIYVSGSASFSPGVKAQIIFRNQRADGAPHEAIATVGVTLIPTGFTLQFPKQPVLGGVGGNPWISVGFTGGDGMPVGPETLLGRCVQLLPGN
jgi:hypothetical protein